MSPERVLDGLARRTRSRVSGEQMLTPSKAVLAIEVKVSGLGSLAVHPPITSRSALMEGTKK